MIVRIAKINASRKHFRQVATRFRRRIRGREIGIGERLQGARILEFSQSIDRQRSDILCPALVFFQNFDLDG